MRDYLRSKDMVKMAVTILLNGVKSNIAKENDGSLLLQPSPILIRYLNPKNGREKSTGGIAKALSLTFRYYVMTADNPADIYFRAILFVYTISGIDLSYWYGFLTSPKLKIAEEYRDKLFGLIQHLFEAFNNKEEVVASEIRNIAFEAAFGAAWRIDPGRLDVPMVVYMNFSNGWNAYLTLSERQRNRIPGIEKRIRQKIDRTMTFIFDLLDARKPAAFVELHPNVGGHASLMPFKNETDPRWKIWILDIIDTPFGFNLLDWVTQLSLLLRHTNQYDTLSAWIRSYDLLLKEKRQQYANGKRRCTQADAFLLESPLFQKIQKLFTGMSRYLSLQSRINTELGIFGSQPYKHGFQLPQPVQNYRQLIRAMLSFLFRWNDARIVIEDSDENIKEIKSNVIRRYLNNLNAKFKYKIADALYCRVQYELYPEECQERPLTPAQFGELLWQFMYYAFQLDFYMLRMDGSHDEKQVSAWSALIETLLNEMVALDHLPDAEKMYRLKKMLQKRYHQLQIQYSKAYSIRLFPDEIACFRTLDAYAYERSQKLLQYEKHGREDKKANEMSAKITTFICKTRCGNALRYIERTSQFLECLLNIKKPEELDGEYSIAGQDVIITSDNFKYNIYISLKNAEGDRYAIPTDELKELFSDFGTAIALNRCNHTKIDIGWIKNCLMRLIKKIEALASKDYTADDSIKSSMRKHLKQTNTELFDCEEIAELRATLERSYKYILYSEWLDCNMNLTI